MKIQYHLPLLTFKERVILHYVLLEEIDRQDWFMVFLNPLTKQEEVICLQ